MTGYRENRRSGTAQPVKRLMSCRKIALSLTVALAALVLAMRPPLAAASERGVEPQEKPSLPSAGQAHLPAADATPPSPAATGEQREIIIMSDESRELITTSISERPAVSYWHVQQQRRVDERAPVTVVPGVRLSAWREGKAVRIKLDVLTGKWQYNVPPPDVKETRLGVYSITESAAITVEDGVRFGLPVLHFRLGRQVDHCAGTPSGIENLTASIKVEGFPALRGWCYLLLRNDSPRGVIAVGVIRKPGRAAGDRRPEWVSGNPLEGALIAPGATYYYVTNVSAQPGETGDVTREQLSVNLAVFDDGAYEGDEAKAMQILGTRTGYYAALERFTPMLREMLDQFGAHSGNEAKALESLKVKVLRLPEFDAEASRKAEARLKPRDVNGFRVYTGAGMRSAREQTHRWIDAYTRPAARKERRMAFREYWESLLSKAEAAVARWNLALESGPEGN